MKGEFCRLKKPERASQGGDQIYFNRYVDIREVRMNKNTLLWKGPPWRHRDQWACLARGRAGKEVGRTRTEEVSLGSKVVLSTLVAHQ